MTAGYNEGMKATDAKYKIYLHQEVFLWIVFLLKLIDIFKIDNTIEMIGLVGTNKMPKDGACGMLTEYLVHIHIGKIIWTKNVYAVYTTYKGKDIICKGYRWFTDGNTV